MCGIAGDAVIAGEVEPWAGDLARAGLFDPQMVRDYVKRLDAGDKSVRERIWGLVAFQMWHRRWMAAG